MEDVDFVTEPKDPCIRHQVHLGGSESAEDYLASKADAVVDEWEDKLVKLQTEYGDRGGQDRKLVGALVGRLGRRLGRRERDDVEERRPRPQP